MRIGIDLDNTLICYDRAFQRVAREEGLLPASFEGNKAAVKRALLEVRPDGFDPARLGLDRRRVHFEATRDGKVGRIRELGCDVFIDDLPEVLGHSAMPDACRKILFGTEPQDEFEQYVSWKDLRDALYRPA